MRSLLGRSWSWVGRGVSNTGGERSPGSHYHLHTSRTLFRPGARNSEDPYEVLGVARGAGADEVKKQFREMAKKHHPDLSSAPDAKQKMADITAAYELLSDPQKRQFYDQTGMTMDEAGAGGGATPGAGFGAGGFPGGDASFMFTDFAEMFSRMTGAGSGSSPFGATTAARGDDIQSSVSIDFMEAIKGVTKTIQLSRKCTCSDCGGSGCASGSGVSSCKQCGGSGVQRVERGPIIIGLPCRACNGAGQIIQHPCKACKGQGVKAQTKKISITIPPGVRQGMEMRIANEGHAGARGGRAGHLFATINIRSHPVFRIVDDDVHADVGLSLKQCLLGGAVSVPTLDGSLELTIAAGTPPSAVKILKGKGPPKVDSRGNGNGIVHFFLEMPGKLTERQKQIIVEFDQIAKNMQTTTTTPPTHSDRDDESTKSSSTKSTNQQKASTHPPPPPPPPPPPFPPRSSSSSTPAPSA
eukprot:GHVS01098387.1.p1 GENE.GHVS01098387.1~~GHVS01098387.1.p1  ORF type:complete len:469 (-),score=102.00 GHVS01098387.1:208-1614(-)